MPGPHPLTAIPTVSNAVHRGEHEDWAGPAAAALLADAGLPLAGIAVVPDERRAIVDAVRDAISADVWVLVIVGGVGIGPSDLTPEALGPLIGRRLDGVADEIRRRRSFSDASAAALSRPVAGIVQLDGRAPAFIAAGDGSPEGARETAAVVAQLADAVIARVDGEDAGAHARVFGGESPHDAGDARPAITEARRGRRARHGDA